MQPGAPRESGRSAPREMARLMDGYLITQLLYIATALAVPDALADGPRSAETLAADLGADPVALSRVLRGLAAERVLDEFPDGRFGLTPLGACLRGDAPDSMRGAVMARGGLYFQAAAALLDAVREGGVAFERAYGSGMFDYLGRHPKLEELFQGSMAARARQEAVDVVDSFDFGRFDRLVDVGGGTGVLLTAILTAAPHVHGVLFDLPSVVEQGRQRIEQAGLLDRCRFVGGDFFESLPRGGDAYLLSRVLHDWDDESALRILRTCHRAMGNGASVLVVEAVLPERAVENPAAIRMDLNMLLLLGGRERTRSEFERLVETAGFRPQRFVPTWSPVGLAVMEAVRTSVDTASGRQSDGRSEDPGQ